MARITTSPAQSSTAPLPANGKTILIGEDDPFISRMYEIKLKNAGFSVVVKDNGREVYETFKQLHPTLLLLDLNMPELSGFDVLNALHSDGVDMTATPVMILTNSSNPKDRQLASSLGADYMVKAELTPREVLAQINTKLSLVQSEGTAAA